MKPHSEHKDIREALHEVIHHLEHILPGQAPLKDFVHHNTLHGFQHLPFSTALSEARKVLGAFGYLPFEKFREYFQQGRIDLSDIEAVILDDEELEAQKPIASHNGVELRRLDVYRTVLLSDIKALLPHQLSWQMDELDALKTFQPDVDKEKSHLLLERANAQGLTDVEAVIAALWQACLNALQLQYIELHPDELTDLSAVNAKRILNAMQVDESKERTDSHQQVRDESERLLTHLLDKVGQEITLRGFLKAITGLDIFDELRPTLLRHLGLFLDHGMASWHSNDREQGFYQTWRSHALHDPSWVFEDIWDWHEEMSSLPDDPLETILYELQRIGLDQSRWAEYLQCLALELPGWSGMFYWRSHHPGYQGFTSHVSMLDYFAVRLVLERLYAHKLTSRVWNLEARLDLLRWHFRTGHRSEFLVRYYLYNEYLPEYIETRAQQAILGIDTEETEGYEDVAEMIWTWRYSSISDIPGKYTVYRHAWQLFRLSQFLALPPAFVQRLAPPQLEDLFRCVDLTLSEKGSYLWLCAYERHYREAIFNALANNRGRGRWRVRDDRPSGQIVFCMDDREEGIRRHLEELDPRVETMGAAGFFGIAIYWRGVDDKDLSALCPIVVTPGHVVSELAQSETLKREHDKKRTLRLRLKDIIHQETRRNVASSTALMFLLSPFILPLLIAKAFMPRLVGQLSEGLKEQFDKSVQTDVQITAKKDTPEMTPTNKQIGFTDLEQADRIEKFLKVIGLVNGFAPLVALMGHGSNSQNNPHMSAYDCGACSGRHGGPNARVFAAIANRPEVRAILKERGIVIPEDTWFLGAEHNTCHDRISWFDLDKLPIDRKEQFNQLKSNMDKACAGSAHERSRRFMSASLNMTSEQAYQHALSRSYDFSQARPELGHATNAVAFIGRRANTQGAFFDRRMFLISYDPTIDPDGSIVEGILLAAGPVGAGISLEYYFSTVNNDQYGCGTKIMHNLTGMFGVMEGASSDLRTGLPRQMIEIHEAMRLLLIVEQTPECLTAIYHKQPAIQELVGNEWLYVASQRPDTGEISLFTPKKGFTPWKSELKPLQTVQSSVQWYSGHRDPLSPVLIEVKGV
jgi:hypothetical protein